MLLTLDDLNAGDDFDSAVIKNLDASHAEFAGKNFYDCRFEGLAIMEANFKGCTFEECSFSQCDFTMAQLRGAQLRGASFQNCKLMGIDWSPAGGLTFAVSFDACVLTHCLFSDLRMKRTRIADCKVHEATFSGVDLEGADFSGSDLRGSRFQETNLEHADLSSAHNYAINPDDNRLRDTKFSVEAALSLVSRFGIIV